MSLVVLPVQAQLGTWESPDSVGDTEVLLKDGLAFGSNLLFAAGVNNQGQDVVVGLSPTTGAVELELKRSRSFQESSTEGAHFGSSLEVDQERVLVGAPAEEFDGLNDVGAAYLFDAQTGQELRRFVSPSIAQLRTFGSSISLEGNLVAIGAKGSTTTIFARVYVFEADTGALLYQLSSQTFTDDNFGVAVALEENLLAVGASRANVQGVTAAGKVFLYEASTGQLLREIEPAQPTPQAGFGRTLGLDGGVLCSGLEAWVPGGLDPVQCFDASTGALLSSLSPSSPSSPESHFVSLAQAGGQVLVGLSDPVGTGRAHVFDVSTGAESSVFTGAASASAEFGSSVAFDGLQAAAFGLREEFACPNTIGLVQVLDPISEQSLLTIGGDDLALGDVFGTAIAADAGIVLVGATGDDDGTLESGSAYLIDELTGAALFELHSPNPSKDAGFGADVALAGNRALVTSPFDDTAAPGAGAVYVFDASSGALEHQLFASDASGNDQFGLSVAASAGLGLVGAPQAGLPAAGAAYLFDLNTGAELFRLAASDGVSSDRFGEAVAIGNGFLLVSAIRDDDNNLANSGSIYGFDLQTGAELFKLYEDNPTFGARLGRFMVADDDWLVAATDPFVVRRVSVFNLNTQQQVWEQTAPLATDFFGASLALRKGRVLIGQTGSFVTQSRAYLYQAHTGELLDTYTRPGAALEDAEFGDAVALGSDRAYVGSPSLSEVLVFDATPKPFVYCEAKTTSNGCLPAVAFSGAASAGQPGPFQITASEVLNSKPSLLFYGFGHASLPFMGGTLCAAPPLRRTPSQFSGGNPAQAGPDCSGSLTFDMKAWMLSGLDPFLVPGAFVGAQFWFRDPAGSSGVGLTNAVGFEVLP